MALITCKARENSSTAEEVVATVIVETSSTASKLVEDVDVGEAVVVDSCDNFFRVSN